MQDFFLTLPAWAFALTIFVLRVIDMTLATVRFLVNMRGRRTTAWILGFLQSIIFIFAITSILSSLDNILNIIS